MSTRVLQQLRDIVGSGQLVVEPDVMASYAIDWTGRFIGQPTAVVRPGDSREVAAVVALCREAGVALVPQGGNTGLVGGSVPLEGEVVLSLRRLAGRHATWTRWVASSPPAPGRRWPTCRRPQQLPAGRTASISAVVTARRSVAPSPPTPVGSRCSAMAPRGRSSWAVEAVLGTGDTISHMGGLMKDNTGYDLGGLLCGSEGTLGVVTAARVRLVPPSPERVTAILAFSSTAAAVDAASLLRRSLPELQSLELFLQRGLDLVCRVTGAAGPFTGEHSAYLLAEAAAQHDPMPAMAAVHPIRSPPSRMSQLPPMLARRAQLWRYREGHTEAINTLGCAPQARRDAPGAGPGGLHRRCARHRQGRRPDGGQRGCSAMPAMATSTST